VDFVNELEAYEIEHHFYGMEIKKWKSKKLERY
jgi:hypothetical protein